MMIKRITIKGGSGYVPSEDAYEDKLTITDSSVAYEYKPHLRPQIVSEGYRKWSFKTNNPAFENLFDQLAQMTPRYLYSDEILFTKDIGPTEIIATFEDNHRESACYFCPSEYFLEYFRLIRKMVPPCEDMPAVLLQSDDFASNREKEMSEEL